jgi:hypothetical protein
LIGCVRLVKNADHFVTGNAVPADGSRLPAVSDR